MVVSTGWHDRSAAGVGTFGGAGDYDGNFADDGAIRDEPAGGPGLRGGMSGVIYGPAGYVWMRGRNDPASGVGLDPQSWTIMLIWLVLCLAGFMGRIANTAHVAGLLIGLIWGLG